jgi:hypothetical protein
MIKPLRQCTGRKPQGRLKLAETQGTAFCALFEDERRPLIAEDFERRFDAAWL